MQYNRVSTYLSQSLFLLCSWLPGEPTSRMGEISPCVSLNVGFWEIRTAKCFTECACFPYPFKQSLGCRQIYALWSKTRYWCAYNIVNCKWRLKTQTGWFLWVRLLFNLCFFLSILWTTPVSFVSFCFSVSCSLPLSQVENRMWSLWCVCQTFWLLSWSLTEADYVLFSEAEDWFPVKPLGS